MKLCMTHTHTVKVTVEIMLCVKRNKILFSLSKQQIYNTKKKKKRNATGKNRQFSEKSQVLVQVRFLVARRRTVLHIQFKKIGYKADEGQIVFPFIMFPLISFRCYLKRLGKSKGTNVRRRLFFANLTAFWS